MNAENRLREWLDRIGAFGGTVSAAEVVVADDERILFRHASGFRVGGEPLVVGGGARFDAASLTKPWMATLALALDRSGELPVSTRIGALASEAPPRLRDRTLGDLLRHRAGMPAWTPLALRLGRRLGDPDALRAVLLQPLLPVLRPVDGAFRSGTAEAPREGETSAADIRVSRDHGGVSAKETYSDLGYLLWGLLVEQALGGQIYQLLDEVVCEPLGVKGLGSLSLEPPCAVECRLDNAREVQLAAEQGLRLSRSTSIYRGVPQDGNARMLRGAEVAPAHAGLFVTADEVLALAREWLRPSRVLSEELVEAALAGVGEYALGWARQSDGGSSGPGLSSSAFGHTGFTGGSVWIDHERRRIYALLAHRLRSLVDFNPSRREFHRLAAAVGG